MELNALMINRQVLGLPFRRWRPQYTQLNNYISPIPAPFQGEIDPNFSKNDKNRGIYLHWQAPKSMRQGITDSSGTPVFPYLPNRWLVVRFYGTGASRKMKAWVLESDCPNDDTDNRTDDSSPYLMSPDILTLWAQSQSQARKTVAQQTVPTGQPQANTVYNVLLGKVFDLATWTEQGINQQFLTAMAPGNTEFIAYQPMVANIFSFHDKVQNDAEVTEGMALSYFVAGWNSVAGADPLAGVTDQAAFEQVLASLQWELASGGTGTANSLITHGLVYNLIWQNSNAPENQIQNVTDLHVSIGNNAVDAFQNMVNQQLQDQAEKNPALQAQLDALPDASHLLEAFFYDLLYVLDEPGGNIALQNAIREQWFAPKPGGFRWNIINAPDAKLDGIDSDAQAAEIAKEAPWLNQLNADQALYDSLLLQLTRAQNDLFGIWWKYAYYQKNPNPFTNWGVTSDDFANALNPANSAGIVAQINSLNSQVTTQAAKIPQPIFLTPDDTPEVALQNGINAFMADMQNKGLLASYRVLRSVTQPNYYAPNDPVMLLSGARTQQQVLSNSLLPVRTPSQVVSAFVVSGKGSASVQSLGSLLPALSSAALPQPLVALYGEAFLLDPVNAPAISSKIPGTSASEVSDLVNAHAPANYTGTLPAIALQNWVQPWNPLYFEWRVNYYPIGATDAAHNPNWQFDGTDYHYVGTPPHNPSSFNVMGRSIMTSQVSGVFEQRLQAYLDANPDIDPEALAEKLKLDNWDYLVQSFSGFNLALAQTLNANNRLDPTTTISSTKYNVPSQTVQVQQLVAGQTETLPMNVSNPDLQPFQGIRRGQAYVMQMIIYDAFGQALDVVTSSSGLKSSDNFHPILGPELTPDQPIVPNNPWRLFQLPPRMIQPARLSFRLVDAGDPTKYVDTSLDANPVAGWILSNHLENGLSIYDNVGVSLGILRLTVGTDGNKVVGWQPAPHSAIQTLTQFQADAPLMWNWFNSLRSAGPAAFQEFLEAIDATLWSVDPLGSRNDQNLSVLVGRPLALTRAQLQFQLNGSPMRDQTWPKTFDTSVPSYTQENFQIRLGEQELRQDGLIGYYLGQDYTSFHNVHATNGSSSSYLDPIAQGSYISMPFDGHTTQDIMLLLDPRAAVHAMTGLFPVVSLSLPSQYVDPVLSSLEIAFHVAPFLTEIVANPDASSSIANAILIPTPAEQNGTWSWWELGAPLADTPTWVQLGLKQETGVAEITTTDKSLRDGFLQLIINAE
jgi:hypothetical protein